MLKAQCSTIDSSSLKGKSLTQLLLNEPFKSILEPSCLNKILRSWLMFLQRDTSDDCTKVDLLLFRIGGR